MNEDDPQGRHGRVKVMIKPLLIIFFLTYALSGCSSAPQAQNPFSSGRIDADPSSPSACIPIEKLSTEETPEDIFARIDNCMNGEHYYLAGELYFTALAYASFDVSRISSENTAGALGALLMDFTVRHPAESRNKFHAATERITAKNARLCQSLRNRGYPTYEPTYMINYARQGERYNKDSEIMVKNFNPDASWSKYLSNKLYCG